MVVHNFKILNFRLHYLLSHSIVTGLCHMQEGYVIRCRVSVAESIFID